MFILVSTVSSTEVQKIYFYFASSIVSFRVLPQHHFHFLIHKQNCCLAQAKTTMKMMMMMDCELHPATVVILAVVVVVVVAVVAELAIFSVGLAVAVEEVRMILFSAGAAAIPADSEIFSAEVAVCVANYPVVVICVPIA